MLEKTEALETLEINNLEYDVAGVGAVEDSGSELNQAAAFFFSYRTPENAR